MDQNVAYLNDSWSDPTSIGQDKGEEKICVNLVSQASHLSGKTKR
jgi:hypothetical protein